MEQENYPEVENIIKESSYADDIVDSTESRELATTIIGNVASVLKKGNFNIKKYYT